MALYKALGVSVPPKRVEGAANDDSFEALCASNCPSRRDLNLKALISKRISHHVG
jgi:hypothetical protein